MPLKWLYMSVMVSTITANSTVCMMTSCSGWQRWTHPLIWMDIHVGVMAFQFQCKKNPKNCEENPSVMGGFSSQRDSNVLLPTQRTSDMESVSMAWCCMLNTACPVITWSIEQSHKSQDASVPYPTILFWMVHCGIWNITESIVTNISHHCITYMYQRCDYG